MSSDSQNSKQDLHGKVVPIRSGEDDTETERKLATARRLFSLHEYSLCEKVVQEVLALDPHSSKAKALLELASIKLSKRKLYKKMVDSKLPSRLQEPPPPVEPLLFDVDRKPAPIAETSERNPDLHRPTRVRAQERTYTPSTRSNHRSPSVQPEGAGGKPFTPPVNSMRERTIAAMVELLKDRDKGLGDWKDPRFGREFREDTGNITEPPVSDRNEATISIPTPTEPILEALRKPKILSVKEEVETQATKETALQNPTAEKSSLPVNFLPGSLAELFEITGDLRQEQRTEPETTARNVETAPLPTRPTPGEVLGSLAEFFETTEDFRGEQRTELETTPLNVQEPIALVSPPPQERILRVVQLPDVNVFDRITPARETPPHEFIDRKLEQRSEEIRSSEIKAVSVAQIKKYLYQEQYDLCSQELERIRGLFPQSAEIQAFAENTSRRLVDLKAMKNFEGQAKELMRSAVSFYQEGKFPDALNAVQQVLRVNPNHTQAREFVKFVQRRINPEQKKEVEAQPERYCKTCGTSIDSSSQFCHHCGKRLP